MSDTSPQKYGFDTEFGANGEIFSGEESWRLTVPKTEVDAMVADAMQKGRTEQEQSIEASLQDCVRGISGQLEEILQLGRTQAKNCREDAAHLALMVGQKIAGAALDNYQQDQINEIISRTLTELKGNPQVQITVPETMAEALGKQLKELIEHAEYEGAIRIHADPDAQNGSVALQWAEGAVSFCPDEAAKRIDTEVENWLAAMNDHEELPSETTQNPGHGEGDV